MLALPGSDDFIRGLTVDGWIVADEAARLPEDLIAALRPMRAQGRRRGWPCCRPAWSRSDPFWTAWASDDPSFIRIKATADSTNSACSLLAFSSKSDERWGNTPLIANISAFPAVGGEPVHWGALRTSDLHPRAEGATGPAFAALEQIPDRCPNPFNHCNRYRRLR